VSLIVQKYGGSSVSSVEKIKRVAKRISKIKNKGNELVVVVSAMGDTTDKLLGLAFKLNPDPPKRERDMLLSSGEIISSSLLSMALRSLGEEAIAFSGAQGGIITSEVYAKARIQKIEVKNILRELKREIIVVVAGFQGITPQNNITTLGRGGSDTTAVALAAALKADLCEIYTDVEGIYTADPRIVPEARKLKHISYEDTLELASLGTRVIHLRAIELAKKYKITLHIRSSFTEKEGTIIA